MATIFYFTGTGNSLSTARGIADGLQANLVAIKAIMNQEEQLEDDVVGIVTPVYCLDLPRIVKEFLTKYKFSSNSYIFGVATCGGSEGTALNRMKSLLEDRGLKLSHGTEVVLPDNSIIYTTAEEKNGYY